MVYARIIRAIKRMVLYGLSWGILPLIVFVMFVSLMARYRAFRKAQVVVIMPEGGFGHTVQGPDVARRLFSGRRCVFVVLSDYGRHNWKVATIWPDIRLIFLPLTLGITVGTLSIAVGHASWLKKYGPVIVQGFARMVSGSHALFVDSLVDLYARIPIAHDLKTAIQAVPDYSRHHIAVFDLMMKVAARPVHIPLKWREGIQGKLDLVAANCGRPFLKNICCLYLRQKGRGGDASTSSRNGSLLEAYVPAVRLLNRAGFQVLLIGDVPLSSLLYNEFGGLLIDAKNSHIDKEIFDLYAATEADIFIGEHGGGLILPGLNSIPRLIVNAFPYYIALPNSWVYFKKVRDQAGRLVHFRRVFAEYAYNFDISGMTVHNNTAEEIYEAVSCFIEDSSHREALDPNAHVVAQLPDHAWIKYIVNARLSPAFLKSFDREYTITECEARF